MFDTTTEAGKRAESRLREEEISWMTTVRSDGQPQTVPVWFLWDDEGFLIYSQPNRQKLKNIARNPHVGLNLNSNEHGGDVVRLEGTARIVGDAPPASEVAPYVEKYRESIARIGFDVEGFARAYSTAVRVTPGRWQVW
ncbi:MAG: TIGR03667 family PPOX class F420-dependent oxidoreductase [Rubrobacter sp.]